MSGIWIYRSKVKAFFEKKDYSISVITPTSQKQPNVIQLNSARAFELQDEIDACTRMLQQSLLEDERSRITNNLMSARLEFDKLVYS